MMSDQLWRPSHHFSSRKGFINDPNGLIEIEGSYHAFYQHNPDDTVHGPMHWGHAVSKDLVHWQELPIALYPDELGQCFSGTAVVTSDGQVALFYTAHLDRDGQQSLQTQCLVRTDRALTTFTSEPSNPVLDNPKGLIDFRDPKVLWHQPTMAWVMLITQGRYLGLYRSTDLINWQFASEFGHGLGAPGDGVWECPDLIEVSHVDGGTRWVVIVGVWSGTSGGGSGTQYFLGEFDGHYVRHDTTAPGVLWLDHGRDCYAAQSFAGRDTKPPRLLAWCNNWEYANDTPTANFRGSFTLARDLDLIETAHGTRLRQRVPVSVTAAFPLLARDGTPPGPVYRIARQLTLAPGQCLEVRLFGETSAMFTIVRPHDDHRWRLEINREASVAGANVPTAFGTQSVIELAEPRPGNDTLELELFADHGTVELFLGGGVDVATMLFYPADPAGAVATVLSDKACAAAS